MNEKSQLPSKLYLKLGRTTQWLDELTVDPRCDDFSSREVARAVRILVNTLIGRRPRREQQLDELLASHESLEPTGSTGGCDCSSGGAPPNLAKLLNQAFVRLAGEAGKEQDLGHESEAAMYGGMAMAFNAVSTILEGGVEASPATVAVKACVHGTGIQVTTAMRELLTRRGGSQPPFSEEA